MPDGRDAAAASSPSSSSSSRSMKKLPTQTTVPSSSSSSSSHSSRTARIQPTDAPSVTPPRTHSDVAFVAHERVVRARDSRSPLAAAVAQLDPSSSGASKRMTRRRSASSGASRRRRKSVEDPSVLLDHRDDDGDRDPDGTFSSLAFLGKRDGCPDVGNDVLSCSPTEGSKVYQNQYFEFAWSTFNPLFNDVQNVHIYLFDHNSGARVGFWSENKLQGSIPCLANDSFWGANGGDFTPGHTTDFSYNFVIIPETATVHRGEATEPVFTVIQTALPNSILASQSSLSSVASVSRTSAASSFSTQSVASQSSTAAAGLSSSGGTSSTSAGSPSGGTGGSNAPSSSGTVPDSSSGGFPGWAIAVITVLGFLVLCALFAAWFLVMRRVRRQREAEKRDSMGSASPMLEVTHDGNTTAPTSPTRAGAAGSAVGGERASLLGGAAIGGAGAAGLGAGSQRRGTADESSIMSGSDTTQGMLSGADAAIVADAFRQAMRKPDFSGRPVEEDESPGELPAPPSEGLLSEELRKEGKDVRSVPSARNVQVQGSSGDNDS